ncbi:HIT family protein [Geomonas subterranea]|uniref:HIT family protein n=1 Tax=Geomonas subterranea TaxID=2847989 RepID=A0ABX8LL27_9BACT|nr:HIT family protein [Geomonas subterranea]QXE92721.1 HIT family protein [Geomonas subterranea]QXM09179.1 HIT family protein [Geomonas subterranea]
MSSEANCPFCRLDPVEAMLENELAFAFPDGFPVTLGHTLVVPKRHVASFFEVSPEERAAIFDLVGRVRQLLLEKHAPDAFNIGINDGVAAGQTVPHLHIHLIPRYAGDTDDPRGGVRWIMPVKAPYWKRDER